MQDFPTAMKKLRRLWALCWPWLGPLAHGIDQWNGRIGRWASWLVLLMLMAGAWNVVGRYLGVLVGHNLSFNGLIEAQWYLFSLTFLLGASWTLKLDQHVRVDVLQSRWGQRRRALVNGIGTLLLLIPFCLLMIISSWSAVHFSWQILEQSPNPGGLPRYPLKTILPISFLLLILQGIANIIHQLDDLLGPGRRQ